MSRRTTTIAAALSVLALGSPLISSCANSLADISYNSGVDKYEQGDYQGAIADYTKAIKIDPQHENAYSNRGIAKDELGDLQGAIADLNKAIEIDPEYAKAYNNRGTTKGKLKDYQGAIADLNKALEIDPEYTIAYINRGTAKDLLGDLKGACDDWRKAADLGDERSAEWINNQCQGFVSNHTMRFCAFPLSSGEYIQESTLTATRFDLCLLTAVITSDDCSSSVVYFNLLSCFH